MVGVVKELGLVLAPFFFAAILKYSLSEAVIKHHMLILRLELMMTNCMRPSTDRSLQCLQCLRCWVPFCRSDEQLVSISNAKVTK